MVEAAQRVLDLATHELTDAVKEALQQPRRLGGIGLSSAVLLSPFAFVASVAASAAQPGGHPLSVDTLPDASLLHQWLHSALILLVCRLSCRPPHHHSCTRHIRFLVYMGR